MLYDAGRLFECVVLFKVNMVFVHNQFLLFISIKAPFERREKLLMNEFEWGQT